MRGRKRRRGGGGEDNGFAEWGGYMAAKKAKLQDQFMAQAAGETSNDASHIFHGVAIFVNGYSVPSADELKLLMMKHGGIYHHYYRSGQTTHIIATNLPDTKVKRLKTMNVVKPDWIVESIAAGRLLDYREYLLYSHQSRTQLRLMFKPQEQADSVTREYDLEYENSGSSFPSFESEGSTVAEPTLPQDIHLSPAEKVDKEIPSTSKKTNGTIKTAAEAGFLAEFYSNSRLHHISTMGATFKQYVITLRENSKGVFSVMDKLKTWKLGQIENGQCSGTPFKYEKVIMHIDMDCFFVSVGVRNRPDLKGFPVAVTHAKGRGDGSGSHRSGVDRRAEFELYKARKEDKFRKDQLTECSGDVKPWSDWVEDIDESNSMSEIASCNYEARKMGLKNGMFMGQALKLCPNLKTIPYDFEGYKDVSYCLYNTVASYTVDIEAVSCDEMFVDVTSLLNHTGTSPSDLANVLRAEIKEKTGCPCSTGFGSNRLQARLATKRAKPDGQFYLEPSAVQAFMMDIKVTDLPGVGRSTSYKLASVGIHTCLDLQQVPRAKLLADFGHKTGDSLYKHCRGEDTKKLVFGQERKSVSAEVNYGIRFQNHKEADIFLQELCREVHSRLQEVNMKTKFITLKLMVRAKDAPVESAKFLGHGVCDHVSRSLSLLTSTAEIQTIMREVITLFHQMKVDPRELRGIGIQLTRLERAVPAKPSGNLAMDQFLRPKNELPVPLKDSPKKRVSTVATNNTNINEKKTPATSINDFFAVKKYAGNKNNWKPENGVKVDREVLAALPEDIQKEVMKEYGLDQVPTTDDSRPGPSNRSEGEPSETGHNTKGQFLNLSQIDPEVLEELPLDIQQEIKASINQKKSADIISTNNQTEEQQTENTGYSRPAVDGPRLDPGLPVDEVRALIKAWTSCEESPQSCDTTMMADYLQGLAEDRRLEDLELCIACLHRCMEAKQSSQWQEIYHTIIASVQTVMLAVYGLRLWVPKTFQVF